MSPPAALLVFAGGTVGTAARYGVGEALPAETGGWPLATLAVNLAGAFALGALLEYLAVRGSSHEDGGQRLRLLAGTGFCGGFTTYSTLALEADRLGRDGSALAVLYPVASLAAGVVLAAAAAVLVRRVVR